MKERIEDQIEILLNDKFNYDAHVKLSITMFVLNLLAIILVVTLYNYRNSIFIGVCAVDMIMSIISFISVKFYPNHILSPLFGYSLLCFGLVEGGIALALLKHLDILNFQLLILCIGTMIISVVKNRKTILEDIYYETGENAKSNVAISGFALAACVWGAVSVFRGINSNVAWAILIPLLMVFALLVMSKIIVKRAYVYHFVNKYDMWDSVKAIDEMIKEKEAAEEKADREFPNRLR